MIDDAGDVVVELPDEGIDLLEASVTIDLANFANVENVELSGAASVNVFGNDFANEIYGNGGDNLLSGGKGDDLLAGGGGLDELMGGEGDDTYYIVDATTVITESANEGDRDVILSWIDIDLRLTRYDNVENVVLTETADHTVTGDDEANFIYGNTGVNSLVGGAGNDTLGGGGGADILEGGQGDDVYMVDDVQATLTELTGEGVDQVQAWNSYLLLAEFENLELVGSESIDGTGNAADNQVTGNDGSNRLDGGAGADALAGGKGNDVYVIDVTDILFENADEGTDTVEITDAYGPAAYTLSDNFENLTLKGTRDLNGAGNAANNLIVGNSGHNVLTGHDGEAR